MLLPTFALLLVSLLFGCNQSNSVSASAGSSSPASLPHPLTTAASASSSSLSNTLGTSSGSSSPKSALDANWDEVYYKDINSASQVQLTITNSTADGFDLTFFIKGVEVSGQAVAVDSDQASYHLNNYTITFQLSGKTVVTTENAAYSQTLTFAGDYHLEEN